MPFLSFEATDATGRVIAGTFDAASASELALILQKRGLTPRMIDGHRFGGSHPPAPGSGGGVRAGPGLHQSKADLPSPPRAPARADGSWRLDRLESRAVAEAEEGWTIQPLRSRKIRSSYRWALWGQLARLTRSGFSVPTALQHAASMELNRCHKVVTQMVPKAAEGRGLSYAAAHFPKTFSPDVIDTLAVGERSGELPVALSLLEENARYERQFMFIQLSTGFNAWAGGILSFLAANLVEGSSKSIRHQFNSTVPLNPVQLLIQETQKSIARTWPWGLLILVVLLLGQWFVQEPLFRPVRHRLVTWIPVFGDRARAEAIFKFSWALSAMSKAGFSAHQSVRHAAGTIPNLALRADLLKRIGMVQASEPLDKILLRTPLLSPNERAIVANGQLTGSLVAALDSIGKSAKITHETKTSIARVFGLSCAVLISALIIGFVALSLHRAYATNMIDMLNHAGAENLPV